MIDRKEAIGALREIEKAFWYAEKGDAFSGYGKKVITTSIETLRAALQQPEAPMSDEVSMFYRAAYCMYDAANNFYLFMTKENKSSSLFTVGKELFSALNAFDAIRPKRDYTAESAQKTVTAEEIQKRWPLLRPEVIYFLELFPANGLKIVADKEEGK